MHAEPAAEGRGFESRRAHFLYTSIMFASDEAGVGCERSIQRW